MNFKQILSNLTEKYNVPATQVSRYISAIIVGAIAKIIRINEKALTYALNVRFEGRESLVKTNMHVIKMIDEIVGEEYEIKLKKPKPRHKEYMVVSGNDIVGIAKIIGGVRYQSYYPITPAADESLFIESYERITMENGDEIGICILQTEDEIAAISSVIGASLAGARSTTTTSGPGFSLMVEALGWAGNNETPILITYYQRGAPSTGLPTRGGQADLLFTLSASHGEFPRIVLTSGDHIEAFYDTIEALNLAEKYQVPVIHLLDKFIANTIASIPIPNIDEIKIDRGNIAHEEGDYKRFDINNIISPRAYISSKAISWYTGDEHNEEGHITEDPVTRAKMYEKRMNKMKLIETETPQKLKYTYLDEGKDCLLISWGSTKGVCIDALKTLRNIYGINGSHLNIKMFSPFPSREISQIISEYEIDKIIMVENNYLSQASMVISMHTGKMIENKILKYTGRPIYKDELVKAIRNILSGKSKREVLISGA
jgi:2-oxoglutarate ferredoxin oxidoreductase subunit alpha